MPMTFKSATLALLAPVLVLSASPALAHGGDYGRHDNGWHHGERKHDRWEDRRGDRYRDDERDRYRGE